MINETLVYSFGHFKNFEPATLGHHIEQPNVSVDHLGTNLLASRSYSEYCENSCREVEI